MFRRNTPSFQAGKKKANAASGWQNAYLPTHQDVSDHSGGVRLALKSFRALDQDRNGYVTLAQIKDAVDDSGIRLDEDPRLGQFRHSIRMIALEFSSEKTKSTAAGQIVGKKSSAEKRRAFKKNKTKLLSSNSRGQSNHSSSSSQDFEAVVTDEYDGEIKFGFEDFQNLFVTAPGVLHQIFTRDLVIPNFPAFCSVIDDIYYKIKRRREGKVATYIPQLASVNPDNFSISVCTKSGQRYSIGTSSTTFSVQSTSKPVSYCIALEENGEKKVHQHVGREPSGREFNEMVLNSEGLPHNPMINAGAIMSCSLIKTTKPASDRFEHVLDMWTRAMGGVRPGFSNSTYLSERQTAFRNFALGYLMKEKGAFPEGCTVQEVLEFYFQVCSIETTSDDMAVLAGTLASSGSCPTTGARVFDPIHVRNCLSLMYSCGMYDFSGEFAFNYGVPCKSGVSGVVMGIIPDALGIVVYSPPIDQHGNSVRGVKVFEELTKRFNFHMYDVLLPGLSNKTDPTMKLGKSERENIFHLISAAAAGELSEVIYLSSIGMDLDSFDYDRRTPLHLAAAEGHLEVIRYLIRKNVDLTFKDRFGNTPLDEALRHGHKEAFDILQKHGATLSSFEASSSEVEEATKTSGSLAETPAESIAEENGFIENKKLPQEVRSPQRQSSFSDMIGAKMKKFGFGTN